MDGRLKLAIVDDEEAMQFIFESQLQEEVERHGLELLYFSRAHSLISFLEERRPVSRDIIVISDINMPGMDGLTLSHFLSSRFPDMDIYLSSAYLYNKADMRFENTGTKGFFPKPLNFGLIKRLIHDKIAMRKSNRV